ncbi:MAG: hypothetical protein ACP5FZ_07015 [Fidelibacterota bacterium]
MLTVDFTFYADFIISAALLVAPFILYAEMHYRLPFFKGLLYKKQPEIIFDLPRRSETGHIPVLLLIKDAHWFPVTLEKIVIRLMDHEHKPIAGDVTVPVGTGVHTKWFTKIITIDAANFQNQWVHLDCFAYLVGGGKAFIVRNDNYPTLSQKSFEIFMDRDPLPKEDGWLWGDLHVHSSYTEDQVEFGVPPDCYRPLGRTMGLSFCAVTDHSYDLDDSPDSWTVQDPDLRKWQRLLNDIHDLNRSNRDFILIPGEEVSVDNGFGRTVHMNVLNDPHFHCGSGDGMEKSLGQVTESHYATVLDTIPDQSLAFAAHPFEKPPFWHHLLIHRGIWNRRDYHPRLAGFQILNGKPAGDFETGKAFWISQLLKGRRQLIYAGNDSHGNFNRFRQVLIPLLLMHEHQHQIFGQNLTGIKADLDNGVQGIIDALKGENVIISDGPFLSLESAADNIVTINARSTPYFGTLDQLTVFIGNVKAVRETVFRQETYHAGELQSRFDLTVENMPEKAYLRAELTTLNGHFALTNPIWQK